MKSKFGTVYLVGAGPGDPGLITVNGLDALRAADVVVYDRLAPAELLEDARDDAELVSAAKSPGVEALTQSEINALLVERAREGQTVCRLKGGDPFVFGRGGEEALALADAGVPFVVVPGITSAIGAAAYAGIPVTHRGIASAFLVLAGHTSEAVDNTLRSVRPNTVSMVILMGVGARADLAARLMAHGWSADTPAAIVCGASTPDAWTWTGALAQLGAAAPPAGLAGVLVIGEVVRVREVLATASGGVPFTRPEQFGNEVSYGRNR